MCHPLRRSCRRMCQQLVIIEMWRCFWPSKPPNTRESKYHCNLVLNLIVIRIWSRIEISWSSILPLLRRLIITWKSPVQEIRINNADPKKKTNWFHYMLSSINLWENPKRVYCSTFITKITKVKLIQITRDLQKSTRRTLNTGSS